VPLDCGFGIWDFGFKEDELCAVGDEYLYSDFESWLTIKTSDGSVKPLLAGVVLRFFNLFIVAKFRILHISVFSIYP